MHVHDLENYFKDEAEHSFTHTIHSLRFGPQLPDSVIERMATRGATSGAGAWTNHHINPLDGTEQKANEKAFNFMYFVKVVSTAYLPLGWEKQASVSSKRDNIFNAGFDAGYKGSIETHQYSVTSHKRSLQGGPDNQGGHKERIHARGGIPGVFFSYVSFSMLMPSLFSLPLATARPLLAAIIGVIPAPRNMLLLTPMQDISPMKVINREARSKSFSSFLVGVCAVVGGTLTVAAAIDRALYEGAQRVKKLHQG